MIKAGEIQKEANRLRKEGDYNKALLLYQEAWSNSENPYSGAGLLNCYRKLGNYEDALSLADLLLEKYPDFEWGKIEAIWTYIFGELKTKDDSSNANEVARIANKILALQPDDLARKIVIFEAIKPAKLKGDWETILRWTELLSPEALSATPMTDNRGRTGWSDQAQWYNYRIRGLIETGKSSEVIDFIDDVIEKFPQQKKFFLRLKALALSKLSDFAHSEKCYKELCSGRDTDWWLLHEYAKLLDQKGDLHSSYKMMCRACASNRKKEIMVSLFQDVGLLGFALDRFEVAREHLVLALMIRQKQGWKVPDVITSTITKINEKIGNDTPSIDIKTALRKCQKEWGTILPKEQSLKTKFTKKSDSRLQGKVIQLTPDRPFCFLEVNKNESYFCLKKDLPVPISDGEIVSFLLLSSFDKKKKKDSWRAIDIKKTFKH